MVVANESYNIAVLTLYIRLSIVVQTDCWSWLSFFIKQQKWPCKQTNNNSILGGSARVGQYKIVFIIFLSCDYKRSFNAPRRKHMINNLQRKQPIKTTTINAFYFIFIIDYGGI